MTHFSEVPLGWAYPKRKSFLSDLLKSDNGKYNYPLKFQGSNITLPVYPVQLDLPKYRLSNGRTQAAQEEYIAKNSEISEDFFTRDFESDAAQSVQHKLLWNMVEKTALYSYFKDISNIQDQPLILTNEGFVVNGNRRLCAMRELYYSDRDKYSHFAHIEIVILPVCTPKDLDELEAYLQIQPDIKQDYSWIAKACMLRARQQRHGYSNVELASLYDIPEKEIQSMLSQLALADEYLASRGKEKQYDIVEQNEYAFKQLQKGRLQFRQTDQRDLFTQISYVLIDNSDTVEGRLYERIPEVKENLQSIIDQLKQDLPIQQESSKPTLNYDLFGNAPISNELEPLILNISKPENRETVIETVIDIIEGQKEKKKQKSKANAVLKEVGDANAHLKTALNYLSSESNKQGIEEHLKSIEESVKDIREWISGNA